MKTQKFFSLIPGLLILQLALSITLATSINYGMDHSKAPSGFQVWGKDLSGLTQDDGYQLLEHEIPHEVYFKNSTYALNIAQSQKKLRDWLNQEYASPSKFWLIDAFNYLNRMEPQQLSPERLAESEVVPQLENLAHVIDHDGKPASISLSNGRFVIQPGSPHIALDVPASWERLKKSTDSKAVPLTVNTQSLRPEAGDLQKIQNKLGDYTTYFNSNIEGRTNNVRLAAKALNGQLLEPGAEFSFNQVVGKRDKDTGYLPAYIFVDRKVVLDDGGGICQDSSTLYHAVLQAHLELTERNTHSLPVSYVPSGQDATVAFGLLDFRFRNNSKGYLYLDARTGENWIRIRIYGLADSEHPVLTDADGFPMKPADDELNSSK